MSISSTTNRNNYTGNGTTGTYSYTYKIFSQTDLLVTIRDTSDDSETTLTISTDYTVTGVGGTSGGTIVLVSGGQDWIDGSGYLDTGYEISIRRVRPLTQTADIRNQGDFYPEVHEDVFDKLTMVDQQQQDELDRSLKLSESIDPDDFDPSIPAEIVGQNGVTIVTNAAGTALEVGPTTTEISNAQTYATNASASAVLASQWASKIDGQVDATDYSSKAWAIGGTGVTDTASAGAAKEWATKAEDSTVDTSEYSAKHYAAKSSTSAAAAAASATAAQNAAASVIWNDVVFLDNSDSPYTISESDRGKLLSIDCTSGAVTVNLPSIAALDLGAPYVVGIKKTDTSANGITISPDGSDTIDGDSTKTITVTNSGATFIPDIDPSPDIWTTANFGSSAGNLTSDLLSGDGSTTGFSLSVTPGAEENTFVFIDGVYQQKNTYSVSGTTLTFDTAPPSGTNNINVIIGTLLSIGSPADGTVTRAKMAQGALADLSYSTKTTTYTATDSDDLILADTSGGAWTLTLPAASGVGGKRLWIKKTSSDTDALTIDGNGSETIDGETSLTLNGEGAYIEIICDGSNWHIINGSFSSQEIKYDTRAGFGSTNSQIPYFTNTSLSSQVGVPLFTASNSSTLGNSFTALKPCRLNIEFTATHTSTGEVIGISKNATSLSGAGGFTGMAHANRFGETNPSSDAPQTGKASFILAPGDIIRAHCNNAGSNLGTAAKWSVHVTATEI